MQAHLYAGEASYRLRRYGAAEAEFALALCMSEDVGLPEERWKAVYGLGRVAESRADAVHASTDYEEALRIIESLRSGIAASTQRVGFLADQRDVYDAQIGLLKRQPIRR